MGGPQEIPAWAITNARPNPTDRLGRTASQLVVVAAAVMLVVVPVLVTEMPREVARWYAAAADEMQLENKLDAATAYVGKAITWDPDDLSLYHQRAKIELQAKQWTAALQDCDRVRQLDPESSEVPAIRIAALQHLGRHAEGIAEAKRVVRLSDEDDPAQRSAALNTLAYTRAVANRELQEGLEDAEQAIRLLGNSVSTVDPEGYLWFGRAVSALQNKDNDLALTCLNEAAKRATALYKQNSDRLRALSVLPQLAIDYARRVAMLKAQLCGVLYQRAELLDELKRPEDAKRDRQRVKELTKDGNTSRTVPVPLVEAMGILEVEAMYLDSRGFVHYRLNQLAAARRDLDQAIRMSDALDRAYPWLLEARRHLISDIRRYTANQRLLRENLATLLYHRMLTLQALGQESLAERDRQRIIQLGYQPSDALN